MTSSSLINSQFNVGNRVTFLDNLRYLFVFGVVLQHASNAYIDMDWWPVTDGSSWAVGIFNAFFDSFLMPALFFISGYFALPSIRKRNTGLFIKGKLKRLGIPWLIIILTVCPILPLIYHYTRDGMKHTSSYWQTWVAVMQNMIGLDIGILPPMNELMQNDQFYQRYMWFLGLLLVFFVLFAFIYKWKKSWFEKEHAFSENEKTGVGSTLKLLFAVGTITFFGSFVLIMVMFAAASGVSNPESWFTLGNLVQFRVSRVLIHATYFTLGVLANKWQWIERGKYPGHRNTWMISFGILFILLMSVRHQLKQGPEDLKMLFGVLYFFVLNFMCFASLGFFTSIGINYWNQATGLNRILAANSYNMYLAHYIFVLVFQLIFLAFPGIPVIVKFGLVSILSLGFGSLACQYLIRPYPRATGALLIGSLMFMLVLIHP